MVSAVSERRAPQQIGDDVEQSAPLWARRTSVVYLFVNHHDLVKDDSGCRENTAYNLGRGFCIVKGETSNLGVMEGKDMPVGNQCEARHPRQEVLCRGRKPPRAGLIRAIQLLRGFDPRGSQVHINRWVLFPIVRIDVTFDKAEQAIDEIFRICCVKDVS